MTSIEYTLSPNTPVPVTTVDDLVRQGISYIRIQWLDLTNTVRLRVLPISFFRKLLKSSKPSISVTKLAFGRVGGTLIDGFGSDGEYAYVLDLASLKICPYAPRHASVMGYFEEKSLSLISSPTTVPLCPRGLLSKVVDNISKTLSIEFLVGFESEFFLLDPHEYERPIKTTHAWTGSSAIYSGSVQATVMEEIADALVASGIDLEMYHPEGAKKQYEVVTGPLPPLQAADALVHTREIIYNVAHKHGLRATLVPRLSRDTSGNGAHVHFSLHSTDPSIKESEFTMDGLSLRSSEASFIAALLEHLPALTLLTYPTTASYGRMEDGIWSGGTYVCWGVEHRETPLRICNHNSPKSRNFELKMMDGTSNPYLALAGILGMGATGVVKKQVLSQRPLQGMRSAAQLSKKEREELGVTQRLPLDLKQARQFFEASDVVNKVLGDEFKRTYLNINKALDEDLEAKKKDLIYLY